MCLPICCNMWGERTCPVHLSTHRVITPEGRLPLGLIDVNCQPRDWMYSPTVGRFDPMIWGSHLHRRRRRRPPPRAFSAGGSVRRLGSSRSALATELPPGPPEPPLLLARLRASPPLRPEPTEYCHPDAPFRSCNPQARSATATTTATAPPDTPCRHGTPRTQYQQFCPHRHRHSALPAHSLPLPPFAAFPPDPPAPPCPRSAWLLS